MDIVRSIVAEMGFQHRALARELDRWQNRTVEESVFRVHRSQIIRICRALDSARDRLGLPDADENIVGEASTLLRELGARREHLHILHLLWNFFRHKLLQRNQPEFQTFLRAADDMAWACYEPFVAALTESAAALKEPPLTFLSLEPAPFAQARKSSFLPPGLSSLNQRRLYACLRRMPVPLIGLPWLNVGHLPDLVLVAHEVAHIVADDLELAREFEPLLASVTTIPDSRKSHWQSWLDEVFADVVGVLGGGTGFGFGLLRALAGDISTIIDEPADPRGTYPPKRVRMAVVRQTAQHLQLSTDFATAWEDAYGPSNSPFEADIEPLVSALLTHKFARVGSRALPDLHKPPAQTRVDRYIDMLIEEDSPGPPLADHLEDFRAAIVASAMAHSMQPEVWKEGDADGPYARLLRHIETTREDGYRDESQLAAKLRHIDEDDAPLDSPRMQREDASIGSSIADLLSQ